jgi:hypothetical protein
MRHVNPGGGMELSPVEKAVSSNVIFSEHYHFKLMQLFC